MFAIKLDLLTNLEDIRVRKVPMRSHQRRQPDVVPHHPHLCANHALVTMESFSLSCPKYCGLSAITTTPFCTVLLVTSAGRLIRLAASICRVHDMPNRDVAGWVEVALWRRVK